MKLTFIILNLLIVSIFAIPPPLWPARFTQDFVQGDSQTKVYTSGKLWYDVNNNRQRSQFKNDYFDLLCSTVSQSHNTTCSQVIMNDNLYIWLPDENQCCKCCTSAEGCNITPKDWLKEYEYVGVKSMNWDVFNVWTHYDMPVNTTYYATISDVPIPRRMQMGSYGIDFIVNSYTQDPINESVFNIPNYCEKDCPKTSFCANFRSGKSSKKYTNLFQIPRKLVQNLKKIRSQKIE